MLSFVMMVVVPFFEAIVVSWIFGRWYRRRIYNRGMVYGSHETLRRLAPLLAGAGVPLRDVELALGIRIETGQPN